MGSISWKSRATDGCFGRLPEYNKTRTQFGFWAAVPRLCAWSPQASASHRGHATVRKLLATIRRFEHLIFEGFVAFIKPCRNGHACHTGRLLNSQKDATIHHNLSA